MKYHIEFTDDLMTLVDEEGNGHDAYLLHPHYWDKADAQLDIWACDYQFDVASAKRELRKLLREM